MSNKRAEEQTQKNKLAVLWPGRNYSCDKPLLYYAGKVFERRGYKVVRLCYNTRLKGNKDDIPGLIEEAKEYAAKELRGIDFSLYDDIVFVSKSMGTALAGYFDEQRGLQARHLYLTPVQEALRYMHRGKCMVVAGKEDRVLESRKLKIYCVEQDVVIKQFEEVGHSLEHSDDINKTFAILMVMIRLYKEF